MTHYILPDGLFEKVAKELLNNGFNLSWQSPAGLRKEAPNSKVKYSCESCGQNCWAKPDAHLLCGNCQLLMMPQN